MIKSQSGYIRGLETGNFLRRKWKCLKMVSANDIIFTAEGILKEDLVIRVEKARPLCWKDK